MQDLLFVILIQCLKDPVRRCVQSVRKITITEATDYSRIPKTIIFSQCFLKVFFFSRTISHEHIFTNKKLSCQCIRAHMIFKTSCDAQIRIEKK